MDHCSVASFSNEVPFHLPQQYSSIRQPFLNDKIMHFTFPPNNIDNSVLSSYSKARAELESKPRYEINSFQQIPPDVFASFTTRSESSWPLLRSPISFGASRRFRLSRG